MSNSQQISPDPRTEPTTWHQPEPIPPQRTALTEEEEEYWSMMTGKVNKH